MLNESEWKFYARQLRLPGFGLEAQLKLKSASVLVVGAGGLGCPLLQYLAAAGVGRIGIADGDRVDLSNLHRQILFAMADVGKPKAQTAAEKLSALNPLIEYVVIPEHITADNAAAFCSGYDLIADASDNFPTRYLINDLCLEMGIPLVHGAVFRYEGQLAVFNLLREDGSRSANYRDLFPVPPAPGAVTDCEEGGVLGVLPGIIGALQALETIKILGGIGQPLCDKMLYFDAWGTLVRTFANSQK